jgi:hypothetical protein
VGPRDQRRIWHCERRRSFPGLEAGFRRVRGGPPTRLSASRRRSGLSIARWDATSLVPAAWAGNITLPWRGRVREHASDRLTCINVREKFSIVRAAACGCWPPRRPLRRRDVLKAVPFVECKIARNACLAGSGQGQSMSSICIFPPFAGVWRGHAKHRCVRARLSQF